jgi:hypothetical protein
LASPLNLTIFLYKEKYFAILMVMENNKDNKENKENKDNPFTPGVNPFTNQAMPGNPPFNPPGETKPQSTAFNPPGEIKAPPPLAQAEVKPAKPASKFDFKIVFLYIILIGLGTVLAKYAFDFFVPKKTKPETPQLINVNAKTAPAPAPASHPFIKFVPGKEKTQPASASAPAATGQKSELPLLSIKKRLTQTVNPYTLSGIFFSGDKNFCIINDKVLAEGDSIEGAKVIQISTDEVELQLNDKSIKLNLRNK